MKIDDVKVVGPVTREYSQILTPEARQFAAKLASNFQARRDELLEKRQVRWAEIKDGKMPTFLDTPKALFNRHSNWTVAPIKPDLECRFVEITGPADDAKMVINALNSGADTYMTDFEDSLSPTWANIISGQINLQGAVDGTLTHKTQKREYSLNDKTATLMVRPRGWHLDEKHALVDDKPISASLFDFGLFIYHNAKKLIEKGKTPALYLPKMESHLDAGLWRDVFNFSEEELSIPHGTLRATVLIETILAAFEMDEILYELKDYSAGLNAGRWDYLFSFIKKFSHDPDFVLPDRAQVTMGEHFLKSYVDLLVQTCHKRGIHAMGGMSALVPRNDDKELNDKAIAAVVRDKELEVKQGCDGAWVAHPGLVKPVREVFEKGISGSHQIHTVKREDVKVTAPDLIRVPKGDITEGGLRTNIRVSLGYLIPWLKGIGCVPIDYKMEDLATVEISRSQVWQWLEHKASLNDGRKITWKLVDKVLKEEVGKLIEASGGKKADVDVIKRAAELFKQVVNTRDFPEFLSLEAYDDITTIQEEPKVETKEDFCARLTEDWKKPRWEGIVRHYTPEDIYPLIDVIPKDFATAINMANETWDIFKNRTKPYIALSSMLGIQTIQYAEAGIPINYNSGWQVAGGRNTSGSIVPDQSIYSPDSMPVLNTDIINALRRAASNQHLRGENKTNYLIPSVSDLEAGFGGAIHTAEHAMHIMEAGGGAIHLEDQLSSAKKCGHLAGKVIVPTCEQITKLIAMGIIADVCNVPLVKIARTDARAAKFLTSDIDPYDRPFLTGNKTPEGFFEVKAGLEQAIARGLAYAPYADVIWCETSEPDIDEARKFAEAIHVKFPGKLLAYNLSPSFNWRAHFTSKKLSSLGITLSPKEISKMGYDKLEELVNDKLPEPGYKEIKKQVNEEIENYHKELWGMGYRFPFITLSGWHTINLYSFLLAEEVQKKGMLGYVEFIQDLEEEAKKRGYKAMEHQEFVGNRLYDELLKLASKGQASTLAMGAECTANQFH